MYRNDDTICSNQWLINFASSFIRSVRLFQQFPFFPNQDENFERNFSVWRCVLLVCLIRLRKESPPAVFPGCSETFSNHFSLHSLVSNAFLFPQTPSVAPYPLFCRVLCLLSFSEGPKEMHRRHHVRSHYPTPSRLQCLHLSAQTVRIRPTLE